MLVNVAVAAAFLVPRKKRSTLLIASLAAAAVLQAGQAGRCSGAADGSRRAAGAGEHSGGRKLDARYVRAHAASTD
jgi:hypothetical protein